MDPLEKAHLSLLTEVKKVLPDQRLSLGSIFRQDGIPVAGVAREGVLRRLKKP